MRTFLPNGVVVAPNENYPITTMTAAECRFWGIPVIWAGVKMNFLRYQTILANQR